jgi:hypothetical protein
MNEAAKTSNPDIKEFLGELPTDQRPTDHAGRVALALEMLGAEQVAETIHRADLARRYQFRRALVGATGARLIALRSEMAELDRRIARYSKGKRFIEAMREYLPAVSGLMIRVA